MGGRHCDRRGIPGHRGAGLRDRLAGAAPARRDHHRAALPRLHAARERRPAVRRGRPADPAAGPRPAAQGAALGAGRALPAAGGRAAHAQRGNRRQCRAQRRACRRCPGAGGAGSAGRCAAWALAAGREIGPARLAAGASKGLASLGVLAGADRARGRLPADLRLRPAGAADACAGRAADPACPGQRALCRMGAARKPVVVEAWLAGARVADHRSGADPGAATAADAIRPPRRHGRPDRRQCRRLAVARRDRAALAAAGCGRGSAAGAGRGTGSRPTRARSWGSTGPAPRTLPDARAAYRRCPARPHRH